MHEVQKVLIEFPYPKEDAVRLLEEHFKDIPQSKRNSWFEEDKVDLIIFDGKSFHFYDFIANLKYRNLDLMKKKFLVKGGVDIVRRKYRLRRKYDWGICPFKCNLLPSHLKGALQSYKKLDC